MARSNKGRVQPKKIVHTINLNVELKRSENRWVRPAKPTVKEKELSAGERQTEDILRRVRGILNKLTQQKFQTLMQQVLELEINTADRLEGVIDILFEKAISEPGFSVAYYTNMCRCLIQTSVKVESKDGKEATLTFRKILLNKCQKEFEKEKIDEKKIHDKMAEILTQGLAEDILKLRKAELDEEERQGRRRTLGNIRFIGELFKLKMLTESIMHDCVVKLLKRNDAESFECFCKLLSTIGKELDHAKAKPRMDQYFDQVSKIIESKKISSRVRFMLQDVRDLRLNNWVPRREDNNRKTIDQIHKEAADEEKKVQIMIQHSKHQKKDKGRDSPRTVVPQADETWTTVPGRGPRNVSVGPKKFQNVQKRTNVDTESISLGPGGRGYGAWARGSSGGTGTASAALQASQNPEQEPRSNRFSALGGEAQRGPGAASSGAGRQETRSPGPGSRRPPSTEREKALEAARNIVQNKQQPQQQQQQQPRPAQEGDSGRASPCQEAEPVAPAESVASAESVAAPTKELSEDEIQNKTVGLINEYHSIKDLKEALECVKDLKSPSMNHKFVSFALNHTVEKRSQERTATGTLMQALLRESIVSRESFLKGLDEVLEFAEDIEIDIPHVWKYLGELVGPVTCDGVLPFTSLYASVCKFVSNKENGAKLMAEMIIAASNGSNPSEVAVLWSRSGLSFNSFFSSQEEAQQFIKSKELESMLGSSSSSGKTSAANHHSNIQEELRNLILKRKARNEEVFKWVDENISDTKDPLFIRALVTAVYESTKKEDGDSCVCSKTLLDDRKNLLQKYIDGNSSLELQALYSLQAMAVQLDHPPGFLRSYFDKLYDEDIISEDSFYAWEKCANPAEQKGKGAAKTSTVQFFKWLNSAEEEAPKDS